MTKQEAYDTICEGLAKQKRRSVDSDRKCMYRGPGGLKCAVGMLIPDDKYATEMDTENWAPCQVLEGIGLPSAILNTVQQLRYAHDCAISPAHLREWLGNIAKLRGVTPGAEKAITEWDN